MQKQGKRHDAQQRDDARRIFEEERVAEILRVFEESETAFNALLLFELGAKNLLGTKLFDARVRRNHEAG